MGVVTNIWTGFSQISNFIKKLAKQQVNKLFAAAMQP